MARNVQLQVTALQALVVAMLAAVIKRDPDMVREIVTDDAFTDVGSMPDLAAFSTKDKRQLQAILDSILRPIRTALGEGPPLGR